MLAVLCVRYTEQRGQPNWSWLPTCFGDVHLVQGVRKRLHQVASKQSKKPFQLFGNAIRQVVKCQQSVLWRILCFSPIKQLQR